MERIELLKKQVDELSSSEVVESVIISEDIMPGMFYYAEDKSFSKELVVGKQVSGVVACVDETGKHGLILLLKQKKLPWSSDLLYAELPQGLSGKENTRLILEAVRKQGKKADAAEWCADYAYDGVKAGEAFLASRDEWDNILDNIFVVNRALRMICDGVLLGGFIYWSSSEYDSNCARYSCFGRGHGLYCDYHKNNNYEVRPVIAF